MPRSINTSLSIDLFSPLYHQPNMSTSLPCLFYTHADRAELALNHLAIQSCIYEVAEKVNKGRNNIYNIDDIAEAINKRLLKQIVSKKGLSVEAPYLKDPNLMRGYFMQYVGWRMLDMLSTDAYWKRWSNSGIKSLDDNMLQLQTISYQTEDIPDPMQQSKNILRLLLLDPDIKITPLNRLKSIMLYIPESLTYSHIAQAHSSSNSLSNPQDIWAAWCANLARYKQIQLNDHKDLKKSRRFCTWVLFRPTLPSEADFALDPTEKGTRENRFNRPVNHAYHKLIKECVIFILLTLDLDSALTLITTLLVPKYIKHKKGENIKNFKRRRRQYQCQLELNIHSWFQRYHNNRFCAGAKTGLARLLQGPSYTSNPAPHIKLSVLESVERTANHIKDHYC